jgi:hypothetical protein
MVWRGGFVVASYVTCGVCGVQRPLHGGEGLRAGFRRGLARGKGVTGGGSWGQVDEEREKSRFLVKARNGNSKTRKKAKAKAKAKARAKAKGGE